MFFIVLNKLRLIIFFILISSFIFIPKVNAQVTHLEVKNNFLYLNGEKWYPKGVSLVSYETPLYNKYHPTHKFDIDEISKIKKFGGNLVRISVSQGGLDPQNKIFSKKYVQRIIQAIKLARQHNMIVILSMQWQSYSDSIYEGGIPTATTYRAWQSLISYIKKDQGIILELFNEPKPFATDENWLQWQQYFNRLIRFIRAQGSNNLLLIDGLNWSTTFHGAPKISDTENKLMFAIHPYLAEDNLKSHIWDIRYGLFSDHHPLIASEFMAWSYPGGACINKLPSITKKLLSYLKRKHIGLVAWAFDFDNLRSRYGTYSSFINYTCPATHIEGAGELIHHYFLDKFYFVQ